MQFLGSIKKLTSLVPWRQNVKWWEVSTELTVAGPKYFWIQIFLDISIDHEQGQICISGLMGKISLAFQNLTRIGKKLETPKNNRFCVPIGFRTNRFTFEKFPPPPPLLHPSCSDSHDCLSLSLSLFLSLSLDISFPLDTYRIHVPIHIYIWTVDGCSNTHAFLGCCYSLVTTTNSLLLLTTYY